MSPELILTIVALINVVGVACLVGIITTGGTE